MVKYCAIKTCKNNSKNFTGFHKFPSDPGIREIWHKNTGIAPENVKNSTFICKSHFEECYYLKRNLKDHAVPTLYLPSTVCVFTLYYSVSHQVLVLSKKAK